MLSRAAPESFAGLTMFVAEGCCVCASPSPWQRSQVMPSWAKRVAGFAKPTEDGKMAATSVRFGPKPGGKATEKAKANNQQ